MSLQVKRKGSKNSDLDMEDTAACVWLKEGGNARNFQGQKVVYTFLT